MSGGKYGPRKAPERACMQVALWPECDRERWESAVQPGDFFSDDGARSRQRPISNRKVEKGYGRWLTFLVNNGGLDAGTAGEDRITRDRVRAYVDEMNAFGNGTYTVLARLQELRAMAKVLAPDRDWSWINRIASKIRVNGKPARDKRSRVKPTDELLALGLALMASAAKAATPRLATIAFRDGLLIALLALRPMRRRDLPLMKMGETLVRNGDGWLICLQPEHTKTHAYYEAPWPECLLAGLDVYLRVHRPVLMRCKSRWHSEIGEALWVSSHGSPMTEQAIYDRVVKVTRAAFGTALGPHLFRDCAATTMATDDPVHVRMAAPLLGHRTSTTTERYYQQAESLSAHRQYTDNLEVHWWNRRKRNRKRRRRATNG